MKQLLFVTVACVFVPGCCLLCTTTRTALTEPLQYCTGREESLASRSNRQLADLVWDSVQEANPGHQFSPDYVRGFKAGFADFMDLGGTGAPPPLPPRHYWKLRYQTPLGREAIQEWYAGFRDGATAARDGCYREGRTVPSSLIIPFATDNDV